MFHTVDRRIGLTAQGVGGMKWKRINDVSDMSVSHEVPNGTASW